MSIAIGIYDFFAYTLPGEFYLFIIVYLCAITGIIKVDSQTLNNLSTIHIIASLMIAYVLGLILDPFARQWHRLFRRERTSKVILERLKKAYPHLEIKFQVQDWPTLRSYLRRENKDLASEIERMSVLRIMLRNVSLSLAIFAVIQVIQSIAYNFYVLNLVIGVVSLIASILAGREAIKFGEWFYLGYYDAIIACASEPADFIVRRQITATEKATETEQTRSNDKEKVEQKGTR